VVSGTIADTQSSDDSVQAIEEETTSGKPDSRFTLLEHRWTLSLPAGVAAALHVEGFRTAAGDGDAFAFEFSTDGGASWTPVSLGALPTSDDGIDRSGALSPTPTGTVEIRVVDTARSAGGVAVDTVSIDHLFVRVVQ
jgi:hypothetical protein